MVLRLINIPNQYGIVLRIARSIPVLFLPKK
jgi:hypothetical protein